MGLIRLLLALSVLLAHTNYFMANPALAGGPAAVQLFFMISGYLMSFVLVEAGSYSDIRAFWINRALRLYPIYYAVALMALLYGAVLWLSKGSGFFQIYQQAPSTANLMLAFSNLFLFGQDWIMFMAVEAGRLVFTTDYAQSEVPLWRGLLITPGWSLGVELTFYLLAPFLLRGRRWVPVLLGCLMLRVVISHADLPEAWHFRFFPAELAYFLLGTASHQLVAPRLTRLSASPRWRWLGLAVICAGIAGYPWLPEGWRLGLLVSLFFFAMPVLFALQRASRIDQVLGELSYPVYIVHMLVLQVIDVGMHHFALDHQLGHALFGVVASVAAAFLLNRWVGGPVERLRDRRRRPGAASLHGAATDFSR